MKFGRMTAVAVALLALPLFALQVQAAELKVASSTALKKVLEALAPQPPDKNKPQPPDQQDRTVVIVIDKDKSMHLNNEDTNMDKLGPRLEDIFKTRAERVVFVKGDPDLEYETVAKAIDIAKGAGMDKIGLMTPKVEAGN